MIEDPYGQYINTSAITAIIVKESSSRDNWNNVKFIQHKKLHKENKSRMWNRTVEREIFEIEFYSIFKTRWRLQTIFSKLFSFWLLLLLLFSSQMLFSFSTLLHFFVVDKFIVCIFSIGFAF
jgi:hypothetical protein